MYSEDDYIQVSALQHYAFCPRQCGLIHIAGIWMENRLTAKGKILHEKVDSGEDETIDGVSITRGVVIQSKRLGLTGKADVVEFHMMNGKKIPYPVEYKSGKPKHDASDLVQLCAQVLCLEEMLDVHIPHAAIFYGKPRKRMIVDIDENLRKQTECTINEIRLMIDSKTIPRAIYTPKCDSCSLFDECMPQADQVLLKQYIEELFRRNEETR